MATLQDYSVIKTQIESIRRDFNFEQASKAFIYFCLDQILKLQEDDILDAITEGGNDRGIDALYIEDTSNGVNVHLFQCKYYSSYEDIKNNNFPSGEIDKIVGFIAALMNKDTSIKNHINSSLYQKITEIWKIFENENPKFIVYICSNLEKAFISTEQERFQRELDRYSSFSVVYYTIDNFTEILIKHGRKMVDAKLNAINENYFEKSEGGLRALVVNVDVVDLLRICCDSDELRSTPSMDNYSPLLRCDLCEDVFDENVRIYLKTRTKINKNIKESALSDDNYKFFYFNNGVTMVCEDFKYQPKSRSPLIEISNFQIVNGGQTIHATYDAFREDLEKIKNTNVLLRIYATRDYNLTQEIAEYTNSQNPVRNRDIRSNDYIQKLLEKELLKKGFFYERKKNFYRDQLRNERIDSEKAGQVMMAFYLGLPGEAKNRRSVIFGERYEEVFHDEINASYVLLPYKLFGFIEAQKINAKNEILRLEDETEIEFRSYILYASYYLLFLLRFLAQKNRIELVYENINQIWEYYTEARSILEALVRQEMAKPKYAHHDLFKGIHLRKLILEKLEIPDN